MNELGSIIQEFMNTFNLTAKSRAAEVLGVSDVQVACMLKGYDIRKKDKGPYRPREATLRMMAENMNQHAEQKGHPYRVTYQQLMAAAGYAPLALLNGEFEEVTDEELSRGELKVPGLAELAADSAFPWDELTPAQRRQIREVVVTTARAMAQQILEGKRQRKLR